MSYTRIPITDKLVYDAYQDAWKDAVVQGGISLKTDYFKTNPNNWLVGYKIDKAIINDFSNNNDVKNVVFSFVVHNNIVKLVLHGASVISNDALSDYYMLETPITVKYPYNKDIILKSEADKLKNRWETTFLGYPNIFSNLLQIAGAGLSGKDAVLRSYYFPLGELETDGEVNIYFGINQYNSRSQPPNTQDLLNLIIHWDTTVYYFDLSQPCPPCCPACP